MTIRGLSSLEQHMGSVAELIASHGVIAYQTDMLNGIGCSIYDPIAVTRLLKIKEREGGKRGLPVIVSGVEAARRIAVVGDMAERLAKRFWPGPLTIILPLTV